MSNQHAEKCRGMFSVWRHSLFAGLCAYLLTCVPVFFGVLVGFEVVRPGREIPYGEDRLLLRFAAWDGGQFMQILDTGYQYVPDRISNIVVFPGYPAMARVLQWSTGLSSAASLLLVSHFCLFIAMVVFHRFVCLRFQSLEIAHTSLAVMALLPTTFFWRMAYSEAPFVLIEVLFLYGVHQKWRCRWLAVLVGLSTAFRLVGVAMLVPLAMEYLNREPFSVRRLLKGSLLLPVSVAGLIAFMVYQANLFGDPFVFIHGQAAFCLRTPVSTTEHWYRLVTLEPLWGNYLAASDAFWKRHSPTPIALLNLQFWNPVYFCLTAACLFYGWFQRVLSDSESALGAGLLLIPYLGRAEEFCMGSQARYASVVVPAIMVLGYFMSRRSSACKAGLAAISGALLAIYSALFGAWYFFL